MKIYLAANYSRHPEMREVRTILEEQGFRVTARWINGFHEALEGQPNSRNATFASEDWEDLHDSNLMIWYATDTPEQRGRGGRHVEFGLALAWGIQIFVIGRKENVFHWLEQVQHFESLDEVLKVIQPFKKYAEA